MSKCVCTVHYKRNTTRAFFAIKVVVSCTIGLFFLFIIISSAIINPIGLKTKKLQSINRIFITVIIRLGNINPDYAGRYGFGRSGSRIEPVQLGTAGIRARFNLFVKNQKTICGTYPFVKSVPVTVVSAIDDRHTGRNNHTNTRTHHNTIVFFIIIVIACNYYNVDCR